MPFSLVTGAFQDNEAEPVVAGLLLDEPLVEDELPLEEDVPVEVEVFDVLVEPVVSVDVEVFEVLVEPVVSVDVEVFEVLVEPVVSVDVEGFEVVVELVVLGLVDVEVELVVLGLVVVEVELVVLGLVLVVEVVDEPDVAEVAAADPVAESTPTSPQAARANVQLASAATNCTRKNMLLVGMAGI